ncbi:MAG: hypothetical protein K9M80_07640 [Candidatus Marinimicrobia bacterium]|nr:hypothetical protein [Candidatus Neomarinimicrobiota bacterium]
MEDFVKFASEAKLFLKTRKELDRKAKITDDGVLIITIKGSDKQSFVRNIANYTVKDSFVLLIELLDRPIPRKVVRYVAYLLCKYKKITQIPDEVLLFSDLIQDNEITRGLKAIQREVDKIPVPPVPSPPTK